MKFRFCYSAKSCRQSNVEVKAAQAMAKVTKSGVQEP